jgi:hypothetical protein
MHPRARSVLRKHCDAAGVELAEIFKSKGRRPDRLQPVVRSVIVDLWDAGTKGRFGPGPFRWSVAEIGRQLNMDPTSVRHHLRVAGIYDKPTNGCVNG